MDSCACPYTVVLDGIPSRILSDRLLSPLCGLMVSRYRRGYAFTSTLEGQELHLHREKVVEDRSISSPYPLLSLWDSSFRETDRTSTGLLGPECSIARPDPNLAGAFGKGAQLFDSDPSYRGSDPGLHGKRAGRLAT